MARHAASYATDMHMHKVPLAHRMRAGTAILAILAKAHSAFHIKSVALKRRASLSRLLPAAPHAQHAFKHSEN